VPLGVAPWPGRGWGRAVSPQPAGGPRGAARSPADRSGAAGSCGSRSERAVRAHVRAGGEPRTEAVFRHRQRGARFGVAPRRAAAVPARGRVPPAIRPAVRGMAHRGVGANDRFEWRGAICWLLLISTSDKRCKTRIQSQQRWRAQSDLCTSNCGRSCTDGHAHDKRQHMDRRPRESATAPAGQRFVVVEGGRSSGGARLDYSTVPRWVGWRPARGPWTSSHEGAPWCRRCDRCVSLTAVRGC